MAPIGSTSSNIRRAIAFMVTLLLQPRRSERTPTIVWTSAHRETRRGQRGTATRWSLLSGPMSLVQLLLQIELPGNAELILNPPVPSAEPVVVEGHEDLSVFSERDEDAFELLIVLALEEQRDRRGHVEGVLDGTVDTGDPLSEQRAERQLYQPCRAGRGLFVGVE